MHRGCKCQLTSVNVVVEGRERGVGRAPAGGLGVDHGARERAVARACAPAAARELAARARATQPTD